MKKTKKILSIFLAVLMIMSSFAFSSSAATYAGQTITGEITKKIGETGTWHRLPRLTNICKYCGGVATENIAVWYNDDMIAVSEEGIIDNIQCSIGYWPGNDDYNGYECFKLTYDAVKAGTVTLTLKLRYRYEAAFASGLHSCGNYLEVPGNYNDYVDTVTITVNVVCPGHVDDNGDYHCDICNENMCPGHVDADGDGKCDNCGADTDAHKHAWDEGKVTENATCDKDGVMTYTCACGETKTEAIQKTCDGTCGCTNAVNNCGGECATDCACKKACDHTNVTFTDNGDGTHDGVCDNCKVTVVDGEEHTDDNGDYKCDKCGANVCPGHIDVDGDGKCDNCGADTDAHKHAWDEGKVTENATCDKDGVITYTCACGETKTEAIKKTCDGTCGCTNAVNNCGGDCADNCACKKACDHTNVTFTDNGDGTHDGVCDNCKATVADNEEHADTDGDYYCDKCAANMCPGHVDVNGDGKCDNCGVDTDVHQHIWDDGKITKSATCDEDGVITYTCACGAKETTTITKRCNGVCGCTDGVKICDGDCAANCACKKDCEHANVTFKDNGDGTHDGVCDTCKAVVVDNEKHADNDKDNKCDKCGADLSTTDPTKPTDPDHKHVDKDGDGYCDECGNKMPIIDGNCDCICHRRGKIWKVFFKLYVVVWKLFGINTVCKCGNYHYTR